MRCESDSFSTEYVSKLTHLLFKPAFEKTEAAAAVEARGLKYKFEYVWIPSFPTRRDKDNR